MLRRLLGVRRVECLRTTRGTRVLEGNYISILPPAGAAGLIYVQTDSDLNYSSRRVLTETGGSHFLPGDVPSLGDCREFGTSTTGKQFPEFVHESRRVTFLH